MNLENVKAQMRKGVLEYCILLILSRKDCYVPDIITILKKYEMIVVEGTLYPLLMRQKNAGLLEYRWEESQHGPPRKYYSLTKKGKDLLHELDDSWNNLVNAVLSVQKDGNN